MVASPGIGGGAAGPWYRVQAITASCLGGTAERDYASVLPGAPLELITNAGPLPAPAAAQDRDHASHPYGDGGAGYRDGTPALPGPQSNGARLAGPDRGGAHPSGPIQGVAVQGVPAVHGVPAVQGGVPVVHGVPAVQGVPVH